MGSCSWFPLRHDQIMAWVERHRDELPTTLAELSRFPMPFRRVIVNEVAPDVRVRLWTEHLKGFMASDSPLNVAQRAFLQTTIPDLPKLLSAPGPNPVISKWEAQAATLFARDQMARMFAQLGAPEPPEGLPIPPDALPSDG